MAWESYRESSKRNWGTDPPTEITDRIQLGCLLRIADAAELMAKDRQRMEQDLKCACDSRDFWRKRSEQQEKSIAAYRGVIKRLKNQLAKENSNG